MSDYQQVPAIFSIVAGRPEACSQGCSSSGIVEVINFAAD